jgi:hypothetical protein
VVEDDMNFPVHLRRFGMAIATVLCAAALSAGSANAAASKASFANCKNSNRSKVVRCCDDLVRKKGKPSWLAEFGNCNKAVVCKSYSQAANFCYLDVYKKGGQDSNDNQPSHQNYKP